MIIPKNRIIAVEFISNFVIKIHLAKDKGKCTVSEADPFEQWCIIINYRIYIRIQTDVASPGPWPEAVRVNKSVGRERKVSTCTIKTGE